MKGKVNLLLTIAILSMVSLVYLMENNLAKSYLSGPVSKIIVSNMPRRSILLITLKENVRTSSKYMSIYVDSRKIYPVIKVSGRCVKVILSHNLLHGEYELRINMIYTISSENMTYEIRVRIGYLEFRNLKLNGNVLSGDIVLRYRDTLIYPAKTILELRSFSPLIIKSVTVVNGHFQLEVPASIESTEISCHGGYIEAMEDKPMIVVHDVLTLKL
ncbi:hypothetical protein DRO21_05745 [archaeon]|nr:MAG: hypothetical protein DRO21_05745 [archaeon]